MKLSKLQFWGSLRDALNMSRFLNKLLGLPDGLDLVGSSSSVGLMFDSGETLHSLPGVSP